VTPILPISSRFFFDAEKLYFLLHLCDIKLIKKFPFVEGCAVDHPHISTIKEEESLRYNSEHEE
jgi:hypothetical protein